MFALSFFQPRLLVAQGSKETFVFALLCLSLPLFYRKLDKLSHVQQLWLSMQAKQLAKKHLGVLGNTKDPQGIQ